jgi:hypothetical protein
MSVLPEVTVLRVDEYDLATMADMTKRSGRTPESIRLLVNGRRGPGGFPPAAGRLDEEQQAQSASPRISLASSTVTVQRAGVALVRLECLGVASCRGTLTLATRTTMRTGDAKIRTTPTVRVAAVGFSFAGDEAKTVRVTLNAAGRGLLKAAHGRLSASLAILELAAGPRKAETTTVRLVAERTHGKPGQQR